MSTSGDDTVIAITRLILANHGTSSQQQVDKLHEAVAVLVGQYILAVGREKAWADVRAADAARLLA